MTTGTDELKKLNEILERISKELENEEDESRRSDLLAQEQRLQARAQKISDETVDAEEGIAERLVDEDGADADSFPKLPDEPGDDED